MLSVVGFVVSSIVLAVFLYLRSLYLFAVQPLWERDRAGPGESDLGWMAHSYFWKKLSEARPSVIVFSALFTLGFGAAVALQSYVTVPMGHEGIVGAAGEDDARVLPPGSTYAKWPWQDSMLIDRSDRVGSLIVGRCLFQANKVSYSYRVPSSLVPAEEYRKSGRNDAQLDFLVKATLRSAAASAYERMPSLASKPERAMLLTAELKKRWSATLLESGIELTSVSCE